MDIELLYKLGKDQANSELKKEAIARQERREEQIINQEKAEKYWKRICKLHRIRYRIDMPLKIEKGNR